MLPTTVQHPTLLDALDDDVDSLHHSGKRSRQPLGMAIVLLQRASVASSFPFEK